MLKGDISTYLTDLVDAEVSRMEKEYRERCSSFMESHAMPVRTALTALASAFLRTDAPFSSADISALLNGAGIQVEFVSSLLDFLEGYGILDVRQQLSKSRLAPPVITYQPGARHLWDYFMAVLIMEAEDVNAANLLVRHPDVADMYGILLIESKGVLPLHCDDLIKLLGEKGARDLTLRSLVNAKRGAAGKFKMWALNEMGRCKEDFYNIVNEIVVQVANDTGHLLGASLLDEYLRTFDTPGKRDILWSVPRKLYDSHRVSMYWEREAVKRLPRLHKDDSWNQMPLVLTWCLSSVSNLRRMHCRNELVRWGLGNPGEFVKLFANFCNCDDPQMREDMFALAEEIVCQGKLSPETEQQFAKLTLDAVFAEPDKPGNRDAAIRYYGRILIERCCADDVIDKSNLKLCRPPYKTSSKQTALPIHSDAVEAKRMTGYGPIYYDLARYVLVDRLESVFGISHILPHGRWEGRAVDRIIQQSAVKAQIDTPSFDGWVISAAYQYMLDCGYDPDVFEGSVRNSGYRGGGIDGKISAAFGCSDHGSCSIVMTVAEKYVWCACNEICGYMADRVPANDVSWLQGSYRDLEGLSLDYGMLLDFKSPLFESTICKLADERAGISPTFPELFSCDDNGIISTEDELKTWINNANASCAIALLCHKPNVRLALKGDRIPVSLYASDWGLGGKKSSVWASGGVISADELLKLDNAKIVAFDGYDSASAFSTTIGNSSSVCYRSPVEYMSSPWECEYEEKSEVTKVADVHIHASPLSGDGVDSLTDYGDYWYRFPSKLAMSICDLKRTDGARYFNASEEVIFEDVKYGEPYRQEYQALLADKKSLETALRDNGLTLIWYVTVQREANSLAKERIPQFDGGFKESWIVWRGDKGRYHSCCVSDKYSEPEHIHDAVGFFKEFLEQYATKIEVEDDGTQ